MKQKMKWAPAALAMLLAIGFCLSSPAKAEALPAGAGLNPYNELGTISSATPKTAQAENPWGDEAEDDGMEEAWEDNAFNGMDTEAYLKSVLEMKVLTDAEFELFSRNLRQIESLLSQLQGADAAGQDRLNDEISRLEEELSPLYEKLAPAGLEQAGEMDEMDETDEKDEQSLEEYLEDIKALRILTDAEFSLLSQNEKQIEALDLKLGAMGDPNSAEALDLAKQIDELGLSLESVYNKIYRNLDSGLDYTGKNAYDLFRASGAFTEPEAGITMEDPDDLENEEQSLDDYLSELKALNILNDEEFALLSQTEKQIEALSLEANALGTDAQSQQKADLLYREIDTLIHSLQAIYDKIDGVRDNAA